MIWCIKTYLIAYVKTQKNKIHYPLSIMSNLRHKIKSVDRALSCILGVTKRDVFWGLLNMYPESYDCGLPGHLAVMRAAMMEPGVHTMSDELMPQISCNIFLAYKWILMMTSGHNYTTAKLSVHVWNHDLIWWQNKIDTQKHFHKTAITSSWTLSKTKIPITIVKAQMPSNPNQKSRMRDNDKVAENWYA